MRYSKNIGFSMSAMRFILLRSKILVSALLERVVHRGPGGRLAQNHFPSMRLVQKCSICLLSYKTCFEKIDGGLGYIPHFLVSPKVFFL
jgi:hypothetical protein